MSLKKRNFANSIQFSIFFMVLLTEIRKDVDKDMLPLFDKAAEIALRAHQGQTDKAGKPYIGHVTRVSSRCHTSSAKVVALLHDVLEDTDTTPEDLLHQGFPQDIIDCLLLMTRQDGQDYEEYVRRLSANPVCREVKIADLEDNMDIRRLPSLKERDLLRIQKYHKAWKFLTT